MANRTSPFNNIVKLAEVFDVLAADDADLVDDVDTLGYRQILIHFIITNQTSGALAFTTANAGTFDIQDSDDGTTYADVDGDRIFGGDSEKVAVATASLAAGATVSELRAYGGLKRYLRIGYDRLGSAPTTAVSGVVVWGIQPALSADEPGT